MNLCPVCGGTLELLIAAFGSGLFVGVTYLATVIHRKFFPGKVAKGHFGVGKKE